MTKEPRTVKKTLGKTLGTASKKPKKPTQEKEGLMLTSLLLEDVKDISYSNQQHLVYEFAVRWWYALPSPWPPVDYDYSQKLKDLNLRRVDYSQFRSEPEEENGLKKVFEIDSYSG